MNKLQEIKDLIEDLKDCVDGNGVPNIHYISNRIADLDKVVNTINYIPCCMGEAEQLIAFSDWIFEQPLHLGGNERKLVKQYLEGN